MDTKLLNEKYIIRGALNEAHGVFLAEDISGDAPEEAHLLVLKILTVYNAEVFKEVRGACPSGIPHVCDMWEESGLLYVVEEHIRGRNLREIIDERKPFRKGYVISESETINTAIQVLKALESLHRLNPPVIHRDVKPSNIIVGDDGKVWLIDLNASKNMDLSAEKDTVLIGTEGYAAPEQYGFGPSGIGTDIYAAGIMMNEMLTGELPSKEKAEGRLRSVIEKCIRLDPSERYRSVQELLTVLYALRKVINDAEPEQAEIADSVGKKSRVSAAKVKYHKWAPPGFRTGRFWKMLIAAAGYAMLFAAGLTLKVKTGTADPAELWLNRIFFILAFLAAALFSANYGNVQKFLGIKKIKWAWLRLIIVIIADAVIIFSTVMLMALAEIIFFGEVR